MHRWWALGGGGVACWEDSVTLLQKVVNRTPKGVPHPRHGVRPGGIEDRASEKWLQVQTHSGHGAEAPPPRTRQWAGGLTEGRARTEWNIVPPENGRVLCPRLRCGRTLRT